jgi:hypothetical protein
MDTVKDLAQIYTNLKLAQAGSRAAKKAAKGYAGVKVAKAGGRRLPGVVLGSAAIAGLVAFLRKRNRQPPGYQPVPSTANPSSVPPAEPVAPPAPGGSQPASPPASTQSPSAETAGEAAETPGSAQARESFPLGSSVTAESEPSAGSAGAPKSGTTTAAAKERVEGAPEGGDAAAGEDRA